MTPQDFFDLAETHKVLTPKQYQIGALLTEKKFPTLIERLDHAFCGIDTERGEVVSEIKRVQIYGKEFTSDMRAHMREELGDMLWYLALAYETFHKQMEDDEIFPDDFAPQDILAEMMLFRIATAVELGKIAKAMQEAYNYDNPAALPPITPFTHIYQYTLRMCYAIGANPREVMMENNQKLVSGPNARYRKGYSDQAAEARADKGGLDHTKS